MADKFIRQHFRPGAERAAQIKSEFDQQVQQVRARNDLSQTGRRRQLAALAVSARDRLRDLADKDAAAVAARRAQLISGLWRNRDTSPVGRMASRDAAIHAASCNTPDELGRLLHVGAHLGDAELASAAAWRAAELADSDPLRADEFAAILDRWAADVPGAPDALAELADIDAEAADPEARLAAGVRYSLVLPGELAADGGRLDQLAADADAAPEATGQRAWPGGAFYNDAEVGAA